MMTFPSASEALTAYLARRQALRGLAFSPYASTCSMVFLPLLWQDFILLMTLEKGLFFCKKLNSFEFTALNPYSTVTSKILNSHKEERIMTIEQIKRKAYGEIAMSIRVTLDIVSSVIDRQSALNSLAQLKGKVIMYLELLGLWGTAENERLNNSLRAIEILIYSR